MNRLVAGCFAVGTAGALSACVTAFTLRPATVPVRPAHVVTVGEYLTRFDALPGDRLDVVLYPFPIDEIPPEARCADMHGTLRVDLVRNVWTCEGVDF